MKKLKKILGAAAILFAVCFFVPALRVHGADSISLPSGEELPSDYINAQQTVDVGSDVNGDVILAGANVSFSGKAKGDILIAGGDVRVTGDTAGSVRIAGGNVTLDGSVAKNVTVAGGTVIVGEDSVVTGNLYVAGGSVELRGRVLGNASVYSSQLNFSGQVQGNADLRSANEVIIRKDARVGGNLTYASGAEVAIAPGVVAGTVQRAPMDQYMNDLKKSEQEAAGATFFFLLWQFLSLLVAGYFLSRVFGKQTRELTGSIQRKEVWNRIAYGLLSLVFNPIVIILTALTVIGLPLALMIVLVYLVFIIAAAALSPVLAGKLLNERFHLYAADERHLGADFVVGFLLMQIVGLVPVLGSLALTGLFLFAFGRISRYVLSAIKQNR